MSVNALRSLDNIWLWSANQFGLAQGDSYLTFLWQNIERLGSEYQKGRPVGRHRYMLVKRRSKGYGHIVIYLVSASSVEILEIFHTAQDWHGYIDHLNRENLN